MDSCCQRHPVSYSLSTLSAINTSKQTENKHSYWKSTLHKRWLDLHRDAFVHIESLKNPQTICISMQIFMCFSFNDHAARCILCSAEAADVIPGARVWYQLVCYTKDKQWAVKARIFFFFITNNNTAHITGLKEGCWHDALAWYLFHLEVFSNDSFGVIERVWKSLCCVCACVCVCMCVCVCACVSMCVCAVWVSMWLYVFKRAPF